MSQAPSKDPPTDRAGRLLALKRRFLAESAAEQVELGQLLGAGLAAGSPSDRRFRKLVHDLRGSGGSYGYPDITAAASRLEEALRDGTAADLALHLAALSAAIAAAGRP